MSEPLTTAEEAAIRARVEAAKGTPWWRWPHHHHLFDSETVASLLAALENERAKADALQTSLETTQAVIVDRGMLLGRWLGMTQWLTGYNGDSPLVRDTREELKPCE